MAAAPVVGVALGAAAAYIYTRRVSSLAADTDGLAPSTAHFRDAYQPPSTWLEALYFFTEALRYIHGETLGRWPVTDLFLGLAYLARRQGQEHPLADLAKQGRPCGDASNHSLHNHEGLLAELHTLERFMNYCLALRERRPPQQRLIFQQLGIGEEDILLTEARAGVLKPSYVIVRDKQLRSIVLAIRGTKELKDLMTSLTGASKPHHTVHQNADGSCVVLGYSHFGMLAAARWIMQQTVKQLREALAHNPGYSLRIIGHSLGGGTAAMLCMMLRDSSPDFASTTCVAIACPACMTLELAKSCSGYVTTIINNADIIPTISPGSADALRREVEASAWFDALRADMRSSAVVRAVEATTSWTSSRVSSASQNIRACYQRRPARKRRNSDGMPADMHDRLLDTVQRMESSSYPPPVQFGEQACSPGRVEVASEWVQGAEQQGGQAGWGQRVQQTTKAVGSSVGQTSKLVVRRANHLLVRSWWQSCQLDARHRPSDEAEVQDTPQHHPGSQLDTQSPPQAMEMDSECEGEAPVAGELPTPQELGAEMHAVQAAVAEAEQEEASQQQRQGPDMPSQGQSPPSQSHATPPDEGWKRMMYPAGKIFQLVPAHLVPGATTATAGARPSSQPDNADEAAPASCFDLPAEEAMAGEGLLAGETNAAAAPSDEPVQEQFMLLEGVPQEAYGRIKLCNTMIKDHFIPVYKANMASALQLFNYHQSEQEVAVPSTSCAPIELNQI
ncbi:hypothetical protein WJX72_001137 [[Myrmecia] bisecta]|uniref:Fungal lipase-type domain-containing protein n=1 Tax=[Myrmecia] bisecta TaxID=41462 RepID=A0AAW1P8H2_9CHLO